MFNPALKKSPYIPPLDGWRALSIGVVVHPSQLQSTVPILGPLLKIFATVVEVCGEIFFAISISSRQPQFLAIDWAISHTVAQRHPKWRHS